LLPGAALPIPQRNDTLNKQRSIIVHLFIANLHSSLIGNYRSVDSNDKTIWRQGID
jgi:hypothetical protein